VLVGSPRAVIPRHDAVDFDDGDTGAIHRAARGAAPQLDLEAARADPKAAPELEPHVVSGMLGYGTYHYVYASGREGDWPILALASRKAAISLYACAAVDGRYVAEDFRDRLPKADIGKSCVRIRKLEDVDLDVLDELVRRAAQGPYAQ